MSRTVVDVAGAFHGGAARFLAELDAYIANEDPSQAPMIVGRGQRLTPRWLARREALASGGRICIALNNASFVVAGEHRIVLLRNALHFATADELDDLSFRPTLDLRAQMVAVPRLASRADRIVVPSSSMAARVVRRLRATDNRLTVRPHPVEQRSWAGSPAAHTTSILVPIVPSPYKNLGLHLDALLEVLEHFGERVLLAVTAQGRDFPQLAHHPRIQWLGRLSVEELDAHWRDAQAVYFPPTIEAFGYPLAEARVNGRYVIAPATAQNREIAAHALCGYSGQDPQSMRAAVERALSGYPAPDPRLFSPRSYFSWLLDGAQ